MIDFYQRTAKMGKFTDGFYDAIVEFILIFALLGLLISCAEVKVQKVPTPTQYEQWTDEMQKVADSLEGFRFYLPRPFINVFESFPIHADVYMTDGVVSSDSKYVLLQIAPDSYLGTILGKVGMDAKIASRLIKPADVDVVRALGEGLRPQAGEVAPPSKEKPKKPSEPADDEKTGIDERAVTNDNSAFAYQPLRGSMDIVYLPDFEEQYVVSSKARLGNVRFGLNLGQGWSLQGFNSLTDNSALNDRIFSLIDEAQKLAFQAAPALLGLPPLPPGTADVFKPQAGEALPETAPGAVPGTPVSVKITIVHYAAKGLYPVVKPREFDMTRQIDISTGEVVTPQQSTNQTRETGGRLWQSRSHIPVYPYQFISFNTFQYLAFELIRPNTAPFNYLYDKTGTAGDPGDRQAADLGQYIIPNLKPSETSEEADRTEIAGDGGIKMQVTKKLAAVLMQNDFSEVEPVEGGAKFRVRSAEVVKVGKVRVKVDKTSGEPSDDLRPEMLKEALVQRAKELGAEGAQKEMISIENFEELTEIAPQAGEVEGPSSGMRAVATDPVAKNLSRWEVRMIQAALCLPADQIDGIWGAKTAKALQRFQEDSNISPADGRITDDQHKTLLEIKGSAIAKRCGPPDPFADQLTRHQIMAIQLALCLKGSQIDGQWGSITKEALRRYQIRIGTAPTDGILTAMQRDKLLNFNGTEIALSCGE